MAEEKAETVDIAPCPGCGRVNPSDARFCATCGLSLVPDDLVEEEHDDLADPLVGRVIADRYRIVALLGRGGMGVVYKIEHVHIGKLMAMKLLHGELTRDRDTVKRFQREAEAASQLNHPNTVGIFDFGRDQGLMYLVMEYLEGKDFGWIIKHEGPLEFARTARICAQVCASVGEAHAKGIIHRDLKPENVMVMQGREHPDLVKVLDFGLAKLRHHDTGQSLTRAGSIIGTPYYMAPEHIRGDQVDARSDLYALGAVMYKAVAGVPPFWASTPMGVLTKHLTDEVVAPSERSSRRDVPADADAIILHAMAKNPAERYQSMDELRADLAAYLASVGEELSDSAVSFPNRAPIDTASGRRRVVQVATRSDVDDYERQIKRKGWLGGVTALLLVGALGAAGVYAFRSYEPSEVAEGLEVEPNDSLERAMLLRPGDVTRAYLGRRRGPDSGDVDLYRIENPGGARRVVRIEVTALPNMNTAIDLVKAGMENPVLVADTGGVGEPERVPNFPLTGSVYYLRVREVRVAGVMPTENVSDQYSVSWDFVASRDDDEDEVNDSLELAGPITPGTARRGYIGWAGDIDTYCLSEDGANLVAELDGVERLDLVLRVVDRQASSSTKIDQGGVGERERSAILPSARRRRTCFEVSANTLQRGAAANADSPYRLRVVSVPTPSVEEGGGP